MKDKLTDFDNQAYCVYERTLERLKSSLTPHQRELLTEFLNATATLQSFSAINHRISGFQDGLKVGEELGNKGVNLDIDKREK